MNYSCFYYCSCVRHKLPALHEICQRDLKFINPLSFAAFKTTQKKMTCLRETLHITTQFLDMAGAHSQQNLFHITFGACMGFKSNAFSLKYSLQKIYHTYSGYLKLSKGNINRFFFFQVCSLINWGNKTFLMKSNKLKQFWYIKTQGYLSYLLRIFGSFKYRSSVYIGVCVYDCCFCPYGFLTSTLSVL